MARSRRRLAALTAGAVVAAVGLTATPGNATSSITPSVLPVVSDYAPQLVTVDTPTRADKDRLSALGLDLTEHAGQDYVEVVLHSATDAARLAGAGFTWDVRIADMLARELERIAIDESFAAANASTDLPSGRTEYRMLADFGTEIDALAAENPTLAKRISIGESVEGRDLTGIEIGRDVTAPEDGRPVMLVFGAHHAREWPSAELPMEFAHDLVNAYTDTAHPDHARIKALLDASRVVVVPVSNPDGYNASRISGQVIDLREVDGGGTVAIIASPGNAYKRKNCNVVEGQAPPAGGCVAVPSPGGFGIGTDLNRNYGALWGGPGASDLAADPTFRGPAPFSEPETQAIRDLISTRQVTTLITNHTFSNLILRPVGVSPTTQVPDTEGNRFPAGFAPDECFTDGDGRDNGMQALGKRMSAATGYSNQFGWELYDTTGTTEDYSYNATGGYGYTFEIGPNEFHPPYEQVVDEYVGTAEAAQGLDAAKVDALTTEAAAECPGQPTPVEGFGGGNREAFLLALENAVDASTHSLITGSAPAGTTIEVERTGVFPLFDGSTVADTVSTSMTVGEGGQFSYHVNPSTRPFVESRMASILGEPREEFSASGFAPPLQSSDTEYVLEAPADVLKATVRATVAAGADSVKAFDLVLLDAAGEEVAAARSFAAENTLAWSGPEGNGVPAGTYTLRVEAGVPVAPAYEVEAAAFDVVSDETPGQTESWTLTCSLGAVSQEKTVTVDRGEAVDAGSVCGSQAVVDVQPLDVACPEGTVPNDVHGDHATNVHDRAIDCVVWWEIAQGKTATEYQPGVPVTREQMASFVSRLVEKAGGSFPASPANAFSDDDASFHHDAINKLAAAGLVDGTGSGKYSPTAAVTRAQMAKFIVGAYEYVSDRTLSRSRNAFSDDDGNTLEPFINAAVAGGFVIGRESRYEPGAVVRRDAMASFLARPLDLLVAEGTTPPKQ